MKRQNPKWLKAARLLAQGMNKAEVARRVGVARTTINNWLANPDFNELLDKMISEHVTKFDETAIRDRDLAQHTLVGVLKDPKATNADKIRAATALQKQGNLSAEMREISRKIKTLEEQMAKFINIQESFTE